jgi:DNA ligase-1
VDALAAVAEQVASTPSRLRKLAFVADYLRGLADDDLARAAGFLAGPMRLSVGWAMLRDAAAAASGLGPEIVSARAHETGDAGEAIALVLEGRTANEPFSLAEAEALYGRLAAARRQAEKLELLRDLFSRCRPLTIKYFVKAMTGELRIGLQRKLLVDAVAQATGAPFEAVRDADNRSGDLAAIAVAARHGRLGGIEARLFHPLYFMLAEPIDSLAEIEDPDNWIVEDKYDGIRAQAHTAGGRAVIFTRGMAEATASFPELETALAALPGALLLDGEIVAWREGRALEFTLLQQRLARKVVPLFLPLEVPVVFMAYDLLYRNGALLLDAPIEERRRLLEEALAGAGEPVLLSPQSAAHSVEDIAELFDAARARGNEGLVLKRRGSRYESGRRSGEWIKWKQPYATLDVVVTAAERGHGKRAGVLSDYTFAVRSAEGFVNVGKAYSGLTDEEIRELTGVFEQAALARHGPVYVVRPEVVLEVAFNGVHKSARHKSGYALRFPRIVRWRHDKGPEDIDTLERVRELAEGFSGRQRT